MAVLLADIFVVFCEVDVSRALMAVTKLLAGVASVDNEPTVFTPSTTISLRTSLMAPTNVACSDVFKVPMAPIWPVNCAVMAACKELSDAW